MKKGVVIGGGVAGLVSASVLASKGYEMVVLEKNATLGGKLQEVKIGGYTFDLGPSVITMPWVLERVFREAGKTVDPQLRFLPLPVNSRNFFASGSVVDISPDADYMLHELAKFSPENREGFLAFLHEVERMYKVAAEHFFENPLVEWGDFFSPRLLKALMSMHPFQSMDQFHRTFFDDPRLIAMMNRYATNVGSSPFETPAAMSLLAYLELVQGVYYIEGGNYRLIEAYDRLARSVGVKIYKNTPVQKILHQNGQVVGVKTEDYVWNADFVISNVDAQTTKAFLLEDHKAESYVPLSMSSFLLLLGVSKQYPHLHHHNHFFPESYGREFIDIFELGEWSLSPAIYVGNSSYSEQDRAPKNSSNLYVIINVPAMEEDQKEKDDIQFYKQYRENVLYWLENDWGMKEIGNSIEIEKLYGPKEIEELTGAYKGAICGPAAHGKRAILRPPMKDPNLKGLYYTGGSTHPGGGIPMSAISGLTVAQLVESQRKQEISWRLRKNGTG